MTTTVILGGARTPIGKLMGSLAGLSAADLGAAAIRAALERSGVRADDVQYTIMGQVLTAGAGQLPARQAAVAAGIPMNTPALTINKVCLSGLNAVALGDQLIRSGQVDIVVAGGQESMSNAPHLLAGVRAGKRLGDLNAVDHAQHDGLWCAFDDLAMGAATEKYNQRYRLTREAQDAFAATSHARAARARADGTLATEIVPVTVHDRRSGHRTIDADEAVRPETTLEALSALPSAFTPDGTITAGNAPGVNDGGAAVVLASETRARELGLRPLAEIGAHGMVAGPDPSLHEQPARALAAALRNEGLSVADLDLIEVNEAFAAVALVAGNLLGVSEGVVNVDGGAIALGHPIGMTGARLVLHLATALHRRGEGTGAVTMCGGGGQGDALVLRAWGR